MSAASLFTTDRMLLARIPLRPVHADGDDGQDPLLREAVLLANARLVRALEAAPLTGRPACTWRGYAVRSRHRTTPNGLFAGVAVANVAGSANPTTLLTLGSAHRARLQLAPEWLESVVQELIADDAVLGATAVVTSNLLVARAGRWECDHHAGRTSVRATEVSTWVLNQCRTGARTGDVIAALVQRHGVSSRHAADALRQLISHGHLLCDLLDLDPRSDPLDRILSLLPEASAHRADLERLRTVLATADAERIGGSVRGTALRQASSLAEELVPGCARPLATDTAADASINLPASLAVQAAEAGEVLWRIAPGPTPLAAYHAAFAARYGQHRAVSVAEVVDPVRGLGPVDAYPNPPARPRPRREAVLAALIHRAVATGSPEVTLDAETLAALDGDAATPPRTVEIYAQVVADSPEHRDAGHYRLALGTGGVNTDGYSTWGRFSELLRPQLHDSLSDALVAELVVRPRKTSAQALAPPAGFATCRIPVGVQPGPGDLSLDDLVATSTGTHLELFSRSKQRRVVPMLYSRVVPELLPDVARLLQLLGHAGSRPVRPWIWGNAKHGPFQPRVRYRQVLLFPARWVLPAALTASASRPSGWAAALDHWRDGTHPPPPSTLLTEDSLLPVDLDDDLDRERLRRLVLRGATAMVEPLGGPGAERAVLAGADGHHALEVVFTLHRRTPPPVPPDRVRPARPAGTGLHLPGSRWLSLTLPCPPSTQDGVLGVLAPFLDGHDAVRHWFWLRYHTPALGHHLRIRCHGRPGVLAGILLPAIEAVGRELIAAGQCAAFSIEPYDQEIERYGGPGSITAAEAVFAADSAAVLQVLARRPGNEERLVHAVRASIGIARALAEAHPDALAHPPLGRPAHRRQSSLRPRTRTIEEEPGAIRQGVIARRDALEAYRDTLTAVQRPACASSLIHMHVNRIGLSEDEPLIRALAADHLAARSRTGAPV